MTADELLEATGAALDRGDRDGVRTVLLQALDASSTVEVLLTAAWSLRWIGDLRSAARAAAEVLALEPGNEHAQYLSVFLRLDAGDRRGAVAMAEAAIAANPSSLRLHYALFETCVVANDVRRAESVVRRMTPLGSEALETLLARCWVLEARRKFAELAGVAGRGETLFPAESAFVIYAGRSLHGRQKLREALERYHRACVMAPDAQRPRTLLRQAETGYFAMAYLSFFFTWMMVGVGSLFLFHLPRQAALIVLLVPIPVAILLQRHLRRGLPPEIVRITEEESARERRALAAHLRRKFSLRG